METFSALLAICAGNSPVTGEFPAQRPVSRSYDVSFDLHLNKRFSTQSGGWWFETPSCSLWRHCNDFSRLGRTISKTYIFIARANFIDFECGKYWLNTTFREVWIKTTFNSMEKIQLKMSSAQYRPLCSGMNVLHDVTVITCCSIGMFYGYPPIDLSTAVSLYKP